MHSSAAEARVMALLDGYYTDIKTIEALRYKISGVPRISPSEMIEDMTFAHADGLGAASGFISDKTAYIALHYRQKTDDANEDAASGFAEKLYALETKCEQVRFFVSLLKGMKGKHHEVICLRYLKGLERPEVCAELGIALRTYDKYHRRAIDRLCELYEMVYGHMERGTK